MPNRVKEYRLAGGMSQRKLAETSGLAARTIARVENDHLKPNLDTMRRILEGLSLETGDKIKVFPYNKPKA